MLRILALVFLGLLCFGVSLSVAFAGDAIGYVAGLDGSAELSRGNQTRNLLLGETIFRGDTIVATPPASVRVDTRGGVIDICGSAKAERECRRFFSTGQSILSVGDWWNRSVAMVNWFRAEPTNLITRSADPPTMLIGNGIPQKIVVGNRSLSFTWSHGWQPFTVSLSSDRRTIVEQQSDTWSVTLPAIRLEPGTISLIIRDSRGQQSTTPITVVSEAPPIPNMSASAVNSDHRSLLEACWLSAHDDGWLIEAYQRLEPIATRITAARAMQRGLAAGDRP